MAVRAVEVAPAEAPDGAADPVRAGSSVGLRVLTMCAAAVPVALYFTYVNHFGVNVLYYDDWGLVPIVHAALHHQLTFSLLWAQHNENRMLVPNLIFLLFGTIGHLDTKAVMFFSAGLFTISFALLLMTYRSYANRWLGPFFTLVIGCVWFSTTDTDNSLWAFQMAWYFILLCLMVALFLLSRREITPLLAVLTGVVATLASFSSLQGLLVWPVGLLVILWRSPGGRRGWMITGSWILAGLLVAALYFNGFNFQTGATGGGSVGFAVRHPFEMLTYFVAAVGNVVSATSSSSLHGHEILGSILSVVAVVVVVQCWRERSTPGRGTIPLPAALILYATLFDLSIAFGRLSFGVAQSLAPRYTMANLLLLIGIALHVIHRADATSRSVHSMKARRSPSALAALGVLLGFLVFQIAWGTHFGIVNGSVLTQSRISGARTVTNLDRMRVADAEANVSRFVYPNLPALKPLAELAEQDHLNVFVPSIRRTYRELGPPSGPVP